MRERRPTLPLCRLAPFCPGEGPPCSGPVEWRLSIAEKDLTFHSCDTHLGPAIRRFSWEGPVEIAPVEEPAPLVSEAEPEPRVERKMVLSEHPIPPADERQTARPGLYSHVHLPLGEERLSRPRAAETDARPHCPAGATPNPGALEQAPAAIPVPPE